MYNDGVVVAATEAEAVSIRAERAAARRLGAPEGLVQLIGHTFSGTREIHLNGIRYIEDRTVRVQSVVTDGVGQTGQQVVFAIRFTLRTVSPWDSPRVSHHLLEPEEFLSTWVSPTN